MGERIFTIGHSTHPAKKLIQLLQRHEVSAVADVRSQPYSRVNPQFNRENLQAQLKAAGIGYVFMGRELGARTDDRSCYINGKVQYDLLARTPLFQEGLERVSQGSSNHRIALMCAEKDPLTCHRTILVCKHLVERAHDVQHILESGHLESHAKAMARLMSELKMGDRDLFNTREELEREAYARRGDQIAYVEKQRPTETARGLAR